MNESFIGYIRQNNVDDWLEEIGLSMYRDKFYKNKIKTLKEMEILKSFNTKMIYDQLEIKKQGNVCSEKLENRKNRST